MWLWCSREQLGSMQPADPNWGSAFPTIAHRTWITTGQTEIITRYLKQLVAYIDSLEAGIKKGGLERIHTKCVCVWLRSFIFLLLRAQGYVRHNSGSTRQLD